MTSTLVHTTADHVRTEPPREYFSPYSASWVRTGEEHMTPQSALRYFSPDSASWTS